MLRTLVAMAACLEADRVDRAVDLGGADDLRDLLGQRGVERQVDRLVAELARVLQPHRVDVADDHHRGAEQARRRRGRQPDRPGTGDVDRAARTDPRRHRAVVAGRQDVGQARQVADLFHRLRAVGKLQQVEVGVRHHHVLGLPAHPAAHVDIAVGAARARRIDAQAHARLLLLAQPAAATGDVERHRNEIAHRKRLDVAAGLDHFAGDLVPEHEAGRRRRAPAHHVLVGAADVGRHHAQDDAVPGRAAARVDQLREIDALHLDLAGAHVHHTAIA